MITLKEWMELANYRITEGGDYYNYGGAYALTSWNGDQNGYSMEIIFDQKTQVVYEVQACDYKHQRAYRLINEAHKNDPSDNEAWDDVKWVDLECDDDWIQKVLSIVAGEDYDTRVSVPVDFTDEELLKYMKLAHDRDMTFNQFIEEALRAAIEEHKNDPEGSKIRAQKWLADRDQETTAV
jgi:hypothetical protein